MKDRYDRDEEGAEGPEPGLEEVGRAAEEQAETGIGDRESDDDLIDALEVVDQSGALQGSVRHRLLYRRLRRRRLALPLAILELATW